MLEPWQITVGRYCVESSTDGFTKVMFSEFIKESYTQYDDIQINQFFDWFANTGLISSLKKVDGVGYYQAKLELVQSIVDFDELRLARRTAESADRNSKLAIGIALITLIISAAVELGWLDVLSTKDNTINIKDSIHTDYIERHIFLD